MIKYLKVWWIFAVNSIQSQMLVRWILAVLLFGKVLRFSIFALFIVVLVNKTKALAGYSLDETIFFFLTFNLIDITSQLFYREVYRFRGAVVTGTFDYYLIRPFNSLFRSLTSGPDILDFITLIPLLGAIFYFITRLQIDPLAVTLYIILVISAFIIATSFYILVLALAVVTTEIDHAVMMYRDISAMGRFPIDIYREPIRGLLTFALPVGIMMSFPVKALLGILSPLLILYALIFSFLFFYLSLKIWDWSLKQYSSASS